MTTSNAHAYKHMFRNRWHSSEKQIDTRASMRYLDKMVDEIWEKQNRFDTTIRVNKQSPIYYQINIILKKQYVFKCHKNGEHSQQHPLQPRTESQIRVTCALAANSDFKPLCISSRETTALQLRTNITIVILFINYAHRQATNSVIRKMDTLDKKYWYCLFSLFYSINIHRINKQIKNMLPWLKPYNSTIILVWEYTL